MITALMLRTHIPFDVWAGQELETIATALELLEPDPATSDD